MGVFIHEGFEHPRIAEAREQGDWERFAYELASVTRPDGTVDISKFDRIHRIEAPNLVTIEGQKYRADLLTANVSNTGLAWYIAEFSSDSTPTTAWTGNFAASSCTEFTGYTSATRIAAAFAAASGTTLVTTTASGQLTISEGVTATVYGACITNNNTKGYSSGAAKLLAAARYPTSVSYAAGQVYSIGYTLTFP